MNPRINTRRAAAAAKTLALVAAVAAFASCNNAEDLYSDEPCYFVFDNSVHNNFTLATAMESSSPGIFCLITEETRSGATYFVFTNNYGDASESIANAIDNQRSRRLGRQNGLIVGYGNGDITNPVFYAYDAQCPICYTGTGLVSRQLTITSNGRATCGYCGRSYDMNNGGYIASGGADGDETNRLTRYYATTTGAYGTLSVGR